MKRLATGVLLTALATPTFAASPSGIDTGRLFFGAGVSQNDVSGADEGTGFQIFGGYEFGQVAQNVALDLEVGYMDSGDIEACATVPFFGRVCAKDNATGLWATGVGRLQLSPQFELLGRAGFDFGDDDGFMFGIGAGFNVSKQAQLRFELVERDDISSLQLNFVYRP